MNSHVLDEEAFIVDAEHQHADDAALNVGDRHLPLREPPWCPASSV